MTRRLLWASLLAGSLLSLVVSVGVSTQSIVVGSRDGNWVYGYLQPFNGNTIAVFTFSGAIAFALHAMPSSLVRRHQWLAVLAWLLVGLIVQGLLRSLTPFTFTQIFVSDTANSFYSPTRQYTATALLSEFDRLRRSLPLHAQSNMPGKLILVSGLRFISRRPEIMAWLVVVLSDLGGVLLYLFVRDLFGDRRVALYSLVLYLFVPAKLFFFPLLNAVTPFVVLTCACVLVRWLQTRKPAYAALFGASLYGLMFFEPLPLVMGLLFALLIARALWKGEWKTPLRQAAIVMIAFAATYAFFVAWFHFDLIATFRQAERDAAAFNAGAQRPYALWVRQNLLEFAFGMGVCQAVVFSGLLCMLVARAVVSTRRLYSPIAVTCFGLAAVLLATDLIGLNRGEVTRLWIFLACFFQIPAAYVCARLRNRAAMMLVLGTTLLEGALGTSMIGFIVP